MCLNVFYFWIIFFSSVKCTFVQVQREEEKGALRNWIKNIFQWSLSYCYVFFFKITKKYAFFHLLAVFILIPSLTKFLLFLFWNTKSKFYNVKSSVNLEPWFLPLESLNSEKDSAFHFKGGKISISKHQVSTVVWVA